MRLKTLAIPNPLTGLYQDVVSRHAKSGTLPLINASYSSPSRTVNPFQTRQQQSFIHPTPSQFLNQPPYYQSPGPDFSDAGDSLERDTRFNPFATQDEATSMNPSMLQRNGYFPPNAYSAVTLQGAN